MSHRCHGVVEAIITDRLASYGAALKQFVAINKRDTGRWLNNRAENSHQPFRRRERGALRLRWMRSLQNSQPCTAPFKTTSTESAHSSAVKLSRIVEPPHSRSGVCFAQPDQCQGRATSEAVLAYLTAPKRPVPPATGSVTGERAEKSAQRLAPEGPAWNAPDGNPRRIAPAGSFYPVISIACGDQFST
jgi:hypothetical protein